MIAMAGMNAQLWLNCSDPLERSIIEAIAKRRAEVASDERQDLAERIISTLGRSIK